ncbi:M28 family metallopeptidase [Polaribacter sp. MED152]|uniref:M28 family metallopeptidase n=1 Tax=Polaribacter sp. MED152 TaxID=313598 RepID=UPI000068C9BE|nr:M28 family metallopeptidase [Polaribacter sp. MED152]EAQ41185.1 peptidase family M28 [Polaribacter sp. MED152]
MKKILYVAGAIAFMACSTSKEASKEDANVDQAAKYAATITAKDLGNHLFTYASDEFQGRETGEPGQKMAVEYLKNFYVSQGIVSPIGGDDYFQEVPAEWINKNTRRGTFKDSENVVAFIEGSEKPEEIVVISAHLDHEGVKNGQVYNGADDDGSGTVAMLEIAEAFQMAAKAGKGPKRSILFLHVTGEEKGLLGSKYYTDVDPIFPLENTVCDLNIDMIGRTDSRHKADPNYVYLIGSDKLSTELHTISEAMNDKYTNINLDYKYNDENDPNRFYYRSDHYNFVKNNVPIIFYFNGTHVDYHKPTDTPDKINYELLENRARLVFHTAWEVANKETRIIADKAKKEETEK